MCRLSCKKVGTISHKSECSNLAQKEYQRCCDNAARLVHREICKEYNLPWTEHWEICKGYNLPWTE